MTAGLLWALRGCSDECQPPYGLWGMHEYVCACLLLLGFVWAVCGGVGGTFCVLVRVESP